MKITDFIPKRQTNRQTRSVQKTPTTCSAKPSYRNLPKAIAEIWGRPPPKATVFPVKFLVPPSLSLSLSLSLIWIVFLTLFCDGLSFFPNYSDCRSRRSSKGLQGSSIGDKENLKASQQRSRNSHRREGKHKSFLALE